MRLRTRIRHGVHAVVRLTRRHRRVVVIDSPRTTVSHEGAQRFYEQPPNDPWPTRP